ncbi:hypothetical protein HNW13_017915 [Shewanella sp. BF02_Schw]|uniref:hypothetical protein n=1 Tax=Shewanella sp. BF02_Schw TaxID=394908 RepID=UPI00177BD36B|nr:hypothetical protein [Shewanella sp. BF02_Schw]MBO1897616.1 hypothetical protein [Shewanella sp. BF02_Schw]
MNSFIWEVHLSGKRKKTNLKNNGSAGQDKSITKPPALLLNAKLPAIYWNNENYSLILKEIDEKGDSVTFQNKTITGMQQSAFADKVRTNTRVIPERYFDVIDSVKLLFKIVLKKSISNWSQLEAIPFWVVIMLLMYYLGNSDIRKIASLLIDMNASVYTLCMGVFGFVIARVFHLLFPANLENQVAKAIDKFALLCYSLTIGASSFVICQSIIDQDKSILTLLALCLLCHFTQYFYLELKERLSRCYQIGLITLIGLIAVLVWNKDRILAFL